MPGIEDPEKIDVIAEDSDGSALLSIMQTAAWSGGGKGDRNRLKRKLATYLRYALEGQMVETYPSLAGRKVTIALMYNDPPPAELAEYWRRRGEGLAKEGVTLVARPLGETVWRA